MQQRHLLAVVPKSSQALFQRLQYCFQWFSIHLEALSSLIVPAHCLLGSFVFAAVRMKDESARTVVANATRARADPIHSADSDEAEKQRDKNPAD